jgi:hypothetical protein
MVHPRQRLGSRFRIGYRGIDPFGVPISSLEPNFLFPRDLPEIGGVGHQLSARSADAT